MAKKALQAFRDVVDTADGDNYNQPGADAEREINDALTDPAATVVHSDGTPVTTQTITARDGDGYRVTRDGITTRYTFFTNLTV
ncbi:hypothetical protein BIV57_17960 [Mangrovactinospora gilvigrisea]|uniref:Uncharacterized protein n=1 Tax=Mangrovactinospora gilvigrisea TaxID=1428644 RepID=A0A1J7BBU0_9ACTN|nr:hypothetical protein [Mangrovactinospora gilvigrisea]OIV36123.1 hypothetical protein BIV57_17960 [Mangrovactinospora gilvigrisea]